MVGKIHFQLNAPEFLLVVIGKLDDVFAEYPFSTIVRLHFYDNSALPSPPTPNDISHSNGLPLFTLSVMRRVK